MAGSMFILLLLVLDFQWNFLCDVTYLLVFLFVHVPIVFKL
jgi:hypothetical protein